jgi:NADH-quinone oxidoreductase subunit H
MAEFMTTYGWPFLWMVFQSVLLLVVLLVIVAYVLYADRKIWAAVQIRRGPNVVGPWGLLQSFADLLKFVLERAGHPVRGQQGSVPAGAAGVGAAGAGRPGRSSRWTMAG